MLAFPLTLAWWVWLWSDVCLFLLEWSAPSAIGIAGLGGGFEIGIEVRGPWYAHDRESSKSSWTLTSGSEISTVYLTCANGPLLSSGRTSPHTSLTWPSSSFSLIGSRIFFHLPCLHLWCVCRTDMSQAGHAGDVLVTPRAGLRPLFPQPRPPRNAGACFGVSLK